MTKSRSKFYHYFLGILVVLLMGIPAPKPDSISTFIDSANFLNQDRDYISAPLVGDLGEHSLFFPEQNVNEVLFYTLPRGFNKTNLFKYPLGSKLQVREDGLSIIEELTGTKTKLDVQQIQAQAVIKNELLGSFVGGINAASDSLVLILDSKREVINFFHYLVSAADASTGQSAAHSLQPILRMLEQVVPSYLKTRLDISNALSAKALVLVNTNRKTNEQIAGLSTELATITSLVNSTDTSLPDEARNNLLLILELIKTDGQKAISDISGTSDNYNLFIDVLERLLGILKQDFIKSKDNVLLESRTEGGSQSRRARSLAATSGSVAGNVASLNSERSSLTTASNLRSNFSDAEKGFIRRNIFFRGLDKNLNPNEVVVVNLDREVLFSQTCRINNRYTQKWVRVKTNSDICAPQAITDITIDYYDIFDFNQALVRHRVDPASPFAFELFQRLISAMRTYYAFTSQTNVYHGEKYYPNIKQAENYYKLISNKYDQIYVTDKGVYKGGDDSNNEVVKFYTNQYYLFSLLTEPDFIQLFTPSTSSSIVASFYDAREEFGFDGGHLILGRGLKNIGPAYFYNSSRFDVASKYFNEGSPDPSFRPKYNYLDMIAPYQKNVEDFGLRVGTYVSVNSQRKKVNNIKFYLGTREIGQYIPLLPVGSYAVGYSNYGFGSYGRLSIGRNNSNFCSVNLPLPASSFTSIVIPGVSEVITSGNRIGFNCQGLQPNISIKIAFNVPLNTNNQFNYANDSSYFGYLRLDGLPSVSGNATGGFVSFDLYKAQGYSQAEVQAGATVINGYPCSFVTEAVVQSRLRQSSQPINSRLGNQINSSGYCQFRSEDLVKMRIVNPAGDNGPAWEGKAVLEDFKRNFTVDKTAPLKKNFATNLGKISAAGRYGDEFQFPFGPDYWLKTNRGDLVFKGDFIYLYNSVENKYDPIYVANWRYNNYNDPASFGYSDAYEILNPILSERAPNFIEAYTATITPYRGARNPSTNFVEWRQSVNFYAAGIENVRSVSVNIRGTNYACGDITKSKNSVVNCNFGGLEVERTCASSQEPVSIGASNKFLDGRAPAMNACSVLITTRDNRVIRLPLLEQQSIYQDRTYSPRANSIRGIYEQTLPNRIYYLGSRPPPYLRLSGGYAAFGNSSVTVNGSPCIRPENIALGKIDEVGCYFKWDRVSTEVVATIKVDGEIVKSEVVSLVSTDFSTANRQSGESAVRDIGINNIAVQGVKSITAGTRTCDFPMLVLPATGASPRMSIPYDGVCYFSVPAKASYVPMNNATVLSHENVSMSVAFTEKGLTPPYLPYYNTNQTSQYIVNADNDYPEKQDKYNKPLIIAQNPLITNTCEQACLAKGLIFDNINYNQNFCSTYQSSYAGSNAAYQGVANVAGRGCQTFDTRNAFYVYGHRNWSTYSATMTFRPSTQQNEGRICPCLRY